MERWENNVKLAGINIVFGVLEESRLKENMFQTYALYDIFPCPLKIFLQMHIPLTNYTIRHSILDIM